MIAAVIATGGGADVQRHLDAFTPVVIGALAHRAQIHRARPQVAAEHFRVAFKAAAGQYHGTAENQIALQT
ncbi:hypothetical protein D3C87_1543970 [compost metagenome]